MAASEVVAILLLSKCARGTPSAECSDNYRANLTYNEGSAAHGNDPLLVSKDGLDLAKMSSQKVKMGTTSVRMSVTGSGPLRNRNLHFRSHPDQVSYGVRSHFSHELAAMDLDGGFASSDGVGYMFAQEARNDPRQYFSFTRCQRFEALP
jgi:hypothetical protein